MFRYDIASSLSDYLSGNKHGHDIEWTVYKQIVLALQFSTCLPIYTSERVLPS